MNSFFIIIFIQIYKNIFCRSKEEWKTRAIYQLLTDRFASTTNLDASNCDLSKYCGGNYQGILQKLDYIEGMGFNAIWISPIIENVDNEWAYHGYHGTNFYKLNWHFGSEEDLINLITECHKRDIWIMVDVVGNHIGNIGNDYWKADPLNRGEHYHDYCELDDWDNLWKVENCRLSGLPDIKQENNWVTYQLNYWIYYLVTKYNIDGIRIDTIVEVPKWFWDKFGASAGVFQIGEAFHGDIYRVYDYQNHLDSIFNYPLYYIILRCFTGSFKELDSYYTNIRHIYPNKEYIANFVENHDNKRFLNQTNNTAQFINAIVFSLLWEGIPVHYYGGEQYFSGGDDPYNREPLWNNFDTNSELYIIIGKVNNLRKKVNIWDYEVIQRVCEDNFYAFTRGNVLACFSNNDGGNYTIYEHEFNNGDKLCNILEDDDCIFVENNVINVNIETYPKVYLKF